MTNHPNRNLKTARALVGKRVEGGIGEDHDTGRVLGVIDARRVEVAWDSGVRTPAYISDLTEI